ncbi:MULTISPECIES: HD domain-containing protein [Brevibacterium]|uniref:HD domain-containing protein n=1 Tax=Brevibacterium TaxID=1696 RepID=UPI001B33927F|nr:MULTISPECIES: HD domain-containing protein [Brevibacterium]
MFNHSLRTYLYARHLAAVDDQDFSEDALFAACLFHDAGTVEDFNGDQRFEIEGADAAARFLDVEGWTPAEIEPVWEAIALHTSAGIAERFGTLPRYLRLGVRVDFGDHDLLGAPDVLADAEAAFARLDIERILSELVVAQATVRSQKAPPATWPGELLRAHLADPDSDLPNRAF